MKNSFSAVWQIQRRRLFFRLPNASGRLYSAALPVLPALSFYSRPLWAKAVRIEELFFKKSKLLKQGILLRKLKTTEIKAMHNGKVYFMLPYLAVIINIF